MKVLQIFGVRFQCHCVVLDCLMKQTDSHIAVCSVGVALTVFAVEFNLFWEIFNSLWKLLHLPVYKPNIGVSDGIVRVEGQRLQEISDRILIFAHILETAPPIVIKDRIGFVKFDSPTKLGVWLLIIFLPIVDHSLGIEDWRETWVNFYQSIEVYHGLVIVLMTFVEQAKVIKDICTFRIDP